MARLKWRKQTAHTAHQRMQQTQQTLPEAVRFFLAALERTQAAMAAWLPPLEDAQATPAERTQASLALMVEANALAQEIAWLAVATRADGQATAQTRRATAYATIKRIVAEQVRQGDHSVEEVAQP